MLATDRSRVRSNSSSLCPTSRPSTQCPAEARHHAALAGQPLAGVVVGVPTGQGRHPHRLRVLHQVPVEVVLGGDGELELKTGILLQAFQASEDRIP